MLIQYIIPPDTIETDHKTQISHFFKGLLMTHLDILMSGKKLGLNGLIMHQNETKIKDLT